MNNNENNGSITLEAAIMVPMFIMIMLFVNGLFVLFMGQQIMSHTLIQSAKSLAFDPYASQRVAADEDDKLAEMLIDIFSVVGGDYSSTAKWYEGDSDDLESVIKERYVAYLGKDETGANELLEAVGVENGIDGLDFSGSTFDKDSGMLTVNLKYTQEYIFNAFDFASFGQEASIKVKVFSYE